MPPHLKADGPQARGIAVREGCSSFSAKEDPAAPGCHGSPVPAAERLLGQSFDRIINLYRNPPFLFRVVEVDNENRNPECNSRDGHKACGQPVSVPYGKGQNILRAVNVRMVDKLPWPTQFVGAAAEFPTQRAA